MVSVAYYVMAWVVRELLYVFVYIEALCHVQHITWGRRTYRLSNFGETLQLDGEKTKAKLPSGMLLNV
jgi:hypothetical protein